MSITLEELKNLRKKYDSPPHIMLLSADDSGHLYFLKGGRKDNAKILDMYRDLHKLIQVLELLLKSQG